MPEKKKRSSAMCDKKHDDSQKLRQETKNYIDNLLTQGIKITKKQVREGMGVSNGFVNNPEISAYIKEKQKYQMEEMPIVDVKHQSDILHKKLMAAYIFQYALLDEQEAFLKEAIKDMEIYLEKKQDESNPTDK